MSDKPQKRLVSKGQYLKTIGDRGVTYASGVFYGLLGVTFLLLSLFSFGYFFFIACLGSIDSFLLGIGVLLLILSMAAFWGCKSCFWRATESEDVAPITRHNTGNLPAAETLVRASNLPPSQHQTELLRAAQYGKESPVGELLRAGESSRKDD